MYSYSPLRYPGGKAKVANFFRLLFQANHLVDGEYVEPYAGGASVALALLFGGFVSRVHINDADPAIYAFWDAVLNAPDELCQRIADARLDVDEWKRQRSIYRDTDACAIDLAFATFYLNRTNRSGVIPCGGVIGGLNQDGPWKIDARFTKPELIRRIQRVAHYRSAINVSQLDALTLLHGIEARLQASRALVYLDPPYYEKGSALYRSFYYHDDHAAVAAAVRRLRIPWVVSYDNVEPVREFYKNHRRIEYGLRYTARERYDGREVMFFSPGLLVPVSLEPTTVTDRLLARHAQDRTVVEYMPSDRRKADRRRTQ